MLKRTQPWLESGWAWCLCSSHHPTGSKWQERRTKSGNLCGIFSVNCNMRLDKLGLFSLQLRTPKEKYKQLLRNLLMMNTLTKWFKTGEHIFEITARRIRGGMGKWGELKLTAGKDVLSKKQSNSLFKSVWKHLKDNLQINALKTEICRAANMQNSLLGFRFVNP